MQYTEEDYAQMYNDLPEGLKDLVLSGRLAILVSAIGSRHGLSADQIADLEPAIEDVCLGLVLKDELVENILKNVNVDQRVANRIAAEAELEILKPFGPELLIARKQKEDLDAKISKNGQAKTFSNKNISVEPKDISDHNSAKKASDFFTKSSPSGETTETPAKNTFDWDSDFAKKPAPKTSPEQGETLSGGINSPLENKINELTESINKLVNAHFGSGERKDDKVSAQMSELLARLEKAEKENEENKKLIRNLQVNKPVAPLTNIFGEGGGPTTEVKIDKQRKVDINHTEPKKPEPQNGNIQITSVSKSIPITPIISTPPVQPKPAEQIISSTVSKDTVDTIVETRNQIIPEKISSKKGFSLDELIKGDQKIKEVKDGNKTGTLVFPGVNDEKKIDIKNVTQKDSMREALLADLEWLKTGNGEKIETNGSENDTTDSNKTTPEKQTQSPSGKTDTAPTETEIKPTNSVSPFQDELLPKTKEERMKALQDKIKSLNKGVSVGGKTNIAASGLDPYRL